MPSVRAQNINGVALSPFSELAADPGGASKTNPVFAEQHNCVYITADYARQLENTVLFDTGSTSLDASVTYKSGVWKYDGQSCYLSGLPKKSASAQISSLTQSGGAGSIPAGTYKYLTSLLYIDAQGNEIELFDDRPTSITLASAKNVTVAYYQPVHATADVMNSVYYNARGGTSSTVGSNATHTMTTGHTLRTGSYCYYMKGGFTAIKDKTRVASWTDTSVTFESAIDINATLAQRVSNMVVRTWRTKTGGTEFFLQNESIVDVWDADGIVSNLDTLLDTQLGYSIRTVRPDYIQYPLPKGETLTTHQGALVVGGGSENDKTITWEDPAFPEFLPLDVNSETIPFTRSGRLRCILGDIGTELAAFNTSSQYQVNGSLTSSQYELAKAADTGSGISGPHAATSVDELIVGVGRRGLLATAGGQSAKDFGLQMLPLFLVPASGSDELLYSKAIVFHDDIRHRVMFFIPADGTVTTSSPLGQTAGASSRLLVWDHLNNTWYEFTFTTKMLPSGGFAIVDDTDFFQQNWRYDTDDSIWTGTLYKRNQNATTTLSEDFLDNCTTYDWELFPQWDDGDEPKVDKAWIELVLYMLQPDYFAASFDVQVRTYRNWNTVTADYDKTVTFSSSTDYEKEVKFNADTKAKRLAVRFTGTCNKSTPVLTGYEYVVDDENYEKERFSD